MLLLLLLMMKTIQRCSPIAATTKREQANHAHTNAQLYDYTHTNTLALALALLEYVFIRIHVQQIVAIAFYFTHFDESACEYVCAVLECMYAFCLSVFVFVVVCAFEMMFSDSESTVPIELHNKTHF